MNPNTHICDNCCSGPAEFTVSLPDGLQEWCHVCAAELLSTDQQEVRHETNQPMDIIA